MEPELGTAERESEHRGFHHVIKREHSLERLMSRIEREREHEFKGSQTEGAEVRFTRKIEREREREFKGRETEGAEVLSTGTMGTRI
jgi:hypothetical protein